MIIELFLIFADNVVIHGVIDFTERRHELIQTELFQAGVLPGRKYTSIMKEYNK